MNDDAWTSPHNQLGEPATTTRMETVTRLREKAGDARGGANRERIRARIAGRFTNVRPMSLHLPQRRGSGTREAPRVARRSGRPVLWLIATAIILVGAVMWTMRSTTAIEMGRQLYRSMRR
jgi:hypothetical protein